MIDRLRQRKLDVLVVGGGATGNGIALDAALRGLSVGLVERGDFSSETSSRSTKLIWAGIKYVGTAVADLLRPRNVFRPLGALSDFRTEMRLVSAAHRERTFMLETQAHLTSWLPIAVPVTSWIMRPPPLGHPIFSIAPFVLPVIFKVYDMLGKFRCPPSYVMSRRQAKEHFPQLDDSTLKYACVFYEGLHNDSRTALAVALTAAEKGASVANYVEMTSLDGKGAQCRDVLTGESWTIHADRVVLAGGPFTDSLLEKSKTTTRDGGETKKAVRGAAGTHVVLKGHYTPPHMGLLDMNTSDSRFMFVVPWLGATVVGTTDRPSTALSSPAAPESDIEWLLNESTTHLKSMREVKREDVSSAWIGWRPLAVDPYGDGSDFQSRDHVVATHPETGVIFVAGGKWTTYREMAKDVVDRISDKPCTTLEQKLVGGDGFESVEKVVEELQENYQFSRDVSHHLATTYGTRAKLVAADGQLAERLHPDFPYIQAEVIYACENEMATTIEDILSLRTRIAFIDSDAAIQVAPKVADLAARALGWTEDEKQANLSRALLKLYEFAGKDRPAAAS